jgi:dTDP-4-dehydrorhamnose 3,5-epimerase-like enzyme
MDKSVLIGPGLGHGFIAQQDDSGIAYLLSSPYSPNFEFDISPMDSDLDINWSQEMLEMPNFVLSAKDESAPSLANRQAQGKLP